MVVQPVAVALVVAQPVHPVHVEPTVVAKFRIAATVAIRAVTLDVVPVVARVVVLGATRVVQVGVNQVVAKQVVAKQVAARHPAIQVAPQLPAGVIAALHEE